MCHEVEPDSPADLREKPRRSLSSSLEFTLRKRLPYALAFLVATLLTAIVSAHFAAKNTKAAYVATTYNIEAFNELHRIESWDNLEKLLLKGCNKEALEYVKVLRP